MWHCSAECREKTNGCKEPKKFDRKRLRNTTTNVPEENNETDVQRRKAAAYDQICDIHKKIETLNPQIHESRKKRDDARKQFDQLVFSYKEQMEKVNQIQRLLQLNEENMQLIIRKMYNARGLQLNPSTCTVESVTAYMSLVKERTLLDEDKSVIISTLTSETKIRDEILVEKDMRERAIKEMVVDVEAMVAQVKILIDKMKQLMVFN